MNYGMLFPGYGSQFVGMGKELYDNSRLVQEYFEEASNCLGVNFVKLCFASSELELSRIEHAYPAIFLLGACTAALCKEAGIVPRSVFGYGIGIYSALFAAGSINMPDGLYLLKKLAQVYTELTEKHTDIGARRIQGLSERTLRQLCKQPLIISSTVDPSEFTVVGVHQALHELDRDVRGIGASAREITTDGILFGPWSQAVVEHFAMYREKVDIKDPQVPLACDVTTALIRDGIAVTDLIRKLICRPLRWDAVYAHIKTCDTLIMPAPVSSMKPVLQKAYSPQPLFMIEKLSDIEDLLVNSIVS